VPLGTQRRCALWTLNPLEQAIFLTLIVVGVALLH
jgi:multisubunit Na+/H+ antiporter MnhC subunit